jgi:hypothetical protein
LRGGLSPLGQQRLGREIHPVLTDPGEQPPGQDEAGNGATFPGSTATLVTSAPSRRISNALHRTS